MNLDNPKKICKNCDYPMDFCYKFCANCGQKDIDKKLSIKDFIEEFFANFYAFDSKVLTSVRYLITKPGLMAKEFTEGKRLKFVNPFKLVLSLAILLGLLISLSFFIDDLKINKTNKPGKSLIKIDTTTTDFDNSQVIVNGDTLKSKDTTWINKKKNIFYTKNQVPKEKQLAGIIEKSKLFYGYTQDYPNTTFDEFAEKHQYQKSFSNKYLYEKTLSFESQEKFFENIFSFMKSNIAYLIFFSLPFFSLLFYIFFYKSGYNFTENLIFTFYLFSNYLLFLVFHEIIYTIMEDAIWGILLAIYNWIYFYKSIKNFYPQKKSIIRIKFVILSFIMPIILFFSIMSIFVISFLMS